VGELDWASEQAVRLVMELMPVTKP